MTGERAVMQVLVSENLHFKSKNTTFLLANSGPGKPFLVKISWTGQECRRYQPITFKDLAFWLLRCFKIYIYIVAYSLDEGQEPLRRFSVKAFMSYF